MTGSIRDYTTNFKFIIPEFNIATWHDYIEENFRSIDALFHNLFGINGFSGIWKTNSQYTAGQVLFVGEDGGSIYEGRLLKVVNDTNTGGFNTFSEAIEAHPKDYELYADASSAQIFSELARDWANKTDGTVKTPEGDDTGEYSAKKYAQDAQSSAINAEHFRLLAETDKNIALEAAVSAETSAQNSETSAQNALVSEQNSKTSETNAKTSEQNALVSEQNAKSSEDNAKVYETNAANSVETQTNNFNTYNNQLLSTTSIGVSEIIDTKTASIDELGSALSDALNEIHLKTDVLDKTMITNCLTYIPQDIKFELVDGTITAKQKSKLWIPYGTTEDYKVGDIDAYGNTVVATSWDGSKFFYAIELQSDISNGFTWVGVGGILVLIYRIDLPKLDGVSTTHSFSGTTLPTSPSNGTIFYKTDVNKIYLYTNNSWISDVCCFPLGISIGGSSGISSIDQTFNGFGYIGNTFFILPDVEGLIPDRFNENGSYKSIKLKTSRVRTTTTNSAITVLFADIYGGLSTREMYYTVDTFADMKSINKSGLYYVKEDNKCYSWAGGSGNMYPDFTPIAFFNLDTTGKITSFNPKTTFQAVDRNDSSWLSGLGMPSGKFINLTLGASGSTYTAPANGYYFLNKVAGVSNAYAQISNKTMTSIDRSRNDTDWCLVWLFATKGETVNVVYNATGKTNLFRFFYAEGEIE